PNEVCLPSNDLAMYFTNSSIAVVPA
ncbi:unnamed protein product, partial [Rotaria sp. Silwood1]